MEAGSSQMLLAHVSKESRWLLAQQVALELRDQTLTWLRLRGRDSLRLGLETVGPEAHEALLEAAAAAPRGHGAAGEAATDSWPGDLVTLRLGP